jgi:Ca2+-binding RTX toxin-like protein
VRLNADGSLDTTFNARSTLDSVANFTAGGSPVVLDGSVVVTDAELSGLNAGAGLFAGASITLARAGGAVAEDVFSGSGNLSFSGGNAMLSGVNIGSVTHGGGTLGITFNVNATQAKVNEALSAIAYANTSGTPPANVQIAWTFSDGNAGAQGSGAALTATGTTTVHITDVGHAIGGTTGADTQTGGSGNDTLVSSAGNDSLNGGAGTDTVDFSQESAPVSVILYGNQSHGLSIGVDTLTAIENIVGSQFNDLVYGDLGANLIQGGLGQDTLDGAEGHDTLQGQDGGDLLNGLAGNDSLDGGEGNDSLYGWADLDTLIGGNGDDRLFGGAQADVLDGGDGADNLEGDDGNDTLTGAVGNDTLRGWNDNDSMDGGDGDDALFGGAGADSMLGGLGADNLEGDDGNDTIAGGVGNDTLRGWNDNDSLDGGDGDDLVVGWSGNDSLVGGLGNDQLFGDDGADTLVGGAGGDVLQGGLGNDVYTFATGFGFDGVKDYDYTAGNSDTFQFNGVNLAELSFAKVGDALKVERTASAGADVIYVNDWYMAGSNGAYKIESWIMGDGTYTAAQIEALII